jgi:hypothetical protein
MSDIFYTPPASGGGTTINSNNNFIPVRQNATTFVDSLLFSTTTILKSVFSGFDRGLYFDYLNNIFFYGTTSSGLLYVNNPNQEVSLQSNGQLYALLDGVNNVGYFGGPGARLNFDGTNNKCNIGDGNGNFNTTYLEVDDFNRIIKTNPTGLLLDFANKAYYLGDFNSSNNGTHLIIDDNGEVLGTFNQGNDVGLLLDFDKRRYYLGDFNNYINGTTLEVREDVNEIKTKNNNGDQGIFLNFVSFEYFFGDFSGVNNQTYILIKDVGKDIVFETNGGSIRHNCNLLQFDGALTSGSASGSSGQHLQVTINGTPYKIKLENP